MSITVKTHTVNSAGWCGHCGIPIPGLDRLIKQQTVSVGDRVGVIETEFTEPVCYKVGSKDGNANCTEGAQ